MQATTNTTAHEFTPHTQHNHDAFYNELTRQYETLFETDPRYAYVKTQGTPAELARNMTNALAAGNANKDGQAIKNACKHFDIAHTYKAIRQFLDAG